jgi:DNA-binding NarL/FixJ family response regulator
MIKILIADDYAVVRNGLKQIIQERAGLHVAGEASNGQEVLEMIHAERWDVLVLDLSMPVRGGLEVLHDVKQMAPTLPVLILSMYPESQYGIRALRAGAAGYMNKECALDELVTAIQKVVAGGKYVSPSLAERLAFELSGGLNKEPHELLSDREYDVMCMIGAGKSPEQIARELSLSVKTISTYRARVLQKLSLNKNAELIRYVLEHNLA